MQPPVRDLQALIDQYTQAYAPQDALLDQQITANDQSGSAQEAGLNAKKDTAFGQIGQSASDKGMFFSGFTPDEQAKYTAGTYLPALASLQQTIASTRGNLQGKKADLKTGAYNQAIGTQEDDRKAQVAWQQEQQRQAAAAEQARLDREQQLKVTNMQIAASRSSGGAPKAATTADRTQAANQLFADAMNYAKSNPGAVGDGFREKIAQTVAAQTGLSTAEIGKLTGAYFPNGWEWQAGIRK